MRTERERNDGFAGGPEPHSDEFSTGTATAVEGRVEVIHGVYAHSLPLVGMTVGEARDELEDRLHIDPESIAVVDGVEVGDDTVLAEGQMVTFVKQSGEKGSDPEA